MTKQFDIAIVGGGMVGLSLAAALSDTSLNIAIIDAQLTSELSEQPETRVSAINLASQQFLKNIGAWDAISAQRNRSYQQMKVWDKDSFGKIEFSAETMQQAELGHIIENTVIRNGLWQFAEHQRNLSLFAPDKIAQVIFGQNENFITLESGEVLSAKWLVAADGANSWLRQQADIPLTFWDYDHTALVATIKTDEPHENTCRQVFLPEGPLAFLPLYQDNLNSIVWSLPAERAEQLREMPEAEFNKVLAAEFGLRLGLCEVQGNRQTIPLKMRYARDFVKGRVVLIGDAAHTIHPLAGQGVNLGFMDAAALAECFANNPDDQQLIRQFERWRKAEAVTMIAAMEGFKHLFSGNNPVKKLIRGVGLSMADQIEPLKQQFVQQAMGLATNIPELAKPKVTETS